MALHLGGRFSVMLTALSIHNIVLIERASLPFESGLCVLSGETGAGKSILLDALGLVLGNRADTSLISQDAEQGSITAEFDVSDNVAIKKVLKDLDIESDGV